MPSPFTLCPKCHTPSTDTWMRLYTGDYTGRVWGGTCNDKRHGKWAESSPCTRRTDGEKQ